MPRPIAIAFNTSLAVLLLQLAQTRILGVVFWNHLVYFIISIALLGFGIAGTWLAFGSDSWLARKLTMERAATGLLVTAIVSSFLVPQLSVSIASLFSGFGQIVQLIIAYTAATFPYFFAGWILGTLFRDHAEDISTLYFADLIGAALGCAIFLVGIGYLGAPRLVVLACLFAALPTLWPTGGGRRRIVTGAVLAVSLAALFAAGGPITRAIQPEPQKNMNLDYAGLAADDERIIEYTEWNALARIDIVTTLKNPGSKWIYIDGGARTKLVVGPPKTPTRFDPAKHDLTYSRTPYFFHRDPERVLVIGAGGGIDVWYALRAGAKRIDAVEINSTTADIGLRRYRGVNKDLFHRKGVRLIIEDGRSFARRTDHLYDVIMIHAIDTFAALNAGAYMLSENYLYTVEGIADYLNRLKPGGTLTITRWAMLSEATRLFTTTLESLRSIGVDKPEKHVIVLDSRALGAKTDTADHWVVLLARRTPFSSAEITQIRQHYAKHGDRLVYPIEVGPRRYITKALHDYARLFTMGRTHLFFAQFPYDVTPVYDDDPFFFHYEKWRDVLNVFSEKGLATWIRGNWPTFTLLSLSAFAVVAVALFIFAPLAGRRGRARFPGFGLWIVYFASLGVSFIFVEIALMQRFALLLGHPSRSLALVLATLLFTAGLGSRAAPRFARRMPAVLAILGGLILAAAYLYPVLGHAALYLPLWMRGALAVALVAPLGFLMGTAFPTGIRLVSHHGERAVPWMWGVNGGTTVLGSLLAIIIAMSANFTTVLVLAALGYAMAMVCLVLLGRRSPADQAGARREGDEYA